MTELVGINTTMTLHKLTQAVTESFVEAFVLHE